MEETGTCKEVLGEVNGSIEDYGVSVAEKLLSWIKHFDQLEHQCHTADQFVEYLVGAGVV